MNVNGTYAFSIEPRSLWWPWMSLKVISAVRNLHDSYLFILVTIIESVVNCNENEGLLKATGGHVRYKTAIFSKRYEMTI